MTFEDTLQGLRNGDFSRLDPLFRAESGAAPRIVQWIEQGCFAGHDAELSEVLTCACFNGRTVVAEHLLSRGIAPSGGAGTGLNAIHWAANRGQLEAVRLLIRHNVPLEIRSMYDGTAIGTAVWAAINEPKPNHRLIIEELLGAGARVTEAGYPTGDKAIDELLKRHGARESGTGDEG